jgi:uncharacterized Zn-finger protein
MMQARDATGRQVSLLNDDVDTTQRAPLCRPVSFQAPSYALQRPYAAPRSISSSPDTPELLRSDSYDSQMSNADPMSPMTPTVDFAYPRSNHYSLGNEFPIDVKRPAYLSSSSRSTSYADEEEHSATSPLPERPGKRYPCRYRDTHGCEKTFTTSGHASRHSKIHTAEKAVQCTFAGCQKKFTRADNMKQHLETHFKEKTRTHTSHRAHKYGLPAETRRNSARSRSAGRDTAPSETEQYPLPTPPLPSPIGTARAWDMRGLNLPLLSRPVVSRNPSSGLDALAMAVACQEGR